MKVVNHTFGSGGILESNLVYPLDRGYIYIAKLDQKWVESMVKILDCSRIGNKYAVLIGEGARQILVTNHDGKYFLTVKE